MTRGSRQRRRRRRKAALASVALFLLAWAAQSAAWDGVTYLRSHVGPHDRVPTLEEALKRAPHYPGWDLIRQVAMTPDQRGGVALDGWGGLHPFGTVSHVSGAAYWPDRDWARTVVLDGQGHGAVFDGTGAHYAFSYS